MLINNEITNKENNRKKSQDIYTIEKKLNDVSMETEVII